MHDIVRDQLSGAEKRALTYRSELDESKLLLDKV